jgi:Na+-translocating ferredoxin:NAD+ oxidoreductase RnfE subunit
MSDEDILGVCAVFSVTMVNTIGVHLASQLAFLIANPTVMNNCRKQIEEAIGSNL